MMASKWCSTKCGNLVQRLVERRLFKRVFHYTICGVEEVLKLG